MTSAALRQACLALVAPAVASGAIPPGLAPRVAELWAAYVATGHVLARPVTLSLHPGVERPRTRGPHTMANTVHRGNELPYDLAAHDAITGAAVGLDGITFTPSVDPPEAGELTQPDADGKLVFRPAADGTGAAAALSVRCEFSDGSDPVTLSDSVVIDPDGRVVGMTAEAERPRTGG